jgi:hypothetical protein
MDLATNGATPKGSDGKSVEKAEDGEIRKTAGP